MYTRFIADEFPAVVGDGSYLPGLRFLGDIFSVVVWFYLGLESLLVGEGGGNFGGGNGLVGNFFFL